MPNVLRLEYDASEPAVTVHVEPTRTLDDGKVIVLTGVRPPQTRFTLAELAEYDATLASDFLSVLLRLDPVTRAKIADDVATPEAIAVKAVEVQRAAEKLAQDRRTARDEMETAAAVQAAHEAESARLDLEIARKQAQLAAMTLAPGNERREQAQAEVSRVR